MNDLSETAYWLAVLAAAPWGRRETKQTLHRLCLEEGLALGALATGADAAAVARSGLTGAELGLLAACAPAARTHQDALRRLAPMGITVLRRDEPAYPESLSSRLGEEWLPYYFYAQGPVELLTAPACAILGGSRPDAAAQNLAKELGARLAAAQWAAVTCYDTDLARQITSAALAADGQAILLLTQGIERFLSALPHQAPPAAGRSLTLSPYPTTQEPTAQMARASELLVAALSETMVLIAPDTEPSDHPWVSETPGWGTRLMIWEGGSAEIIAAWSAAGALPFSSCSQLLGTVSDPQASQPLAVASAAEDQNTPEPQPYQTAEEAMAALARGGGVPDVLAKRLRALAYPDKGAPDAAPSARK